MFIHGFIFYSFINGKTPSPVEPEFNAETVQVFMHHSLMSDFLIGMAVFQIKKSGGIHPSALYRLLIIPDNFNGTHHLLSFDI